MGIRVEQPEVYCCSDIGSTISTNIDHGLFDCATVIDDIYGPMNGFLQCPRCGCSYYFATIAWDREHVVRVISLALLPDDASERLIAFFGSETLFRQWIPTILGRASDEELDQIYAVVDGLIAQAQEPLIVLAWNIRTHQILAAKRPQERSPDRFTDILHDGSCESTHYDWLRELGLASD